MAAPALQADFDGLREAATLRHDEFTRQCARQCARPGVASVDARLVEDAADGALLPAH